MLRCEGYVSECAFTFQTLLKIMIVGEMLACSILIVIFDVSVVCVKEEREKRKIQKGSVTPR